MPTPIILKHLIVALNLTATTYGHGEMMCGDPQQPKACQTGVSTASGEPFDSSIASAALPMPAHYRMRPFTVRLRLAGLETAPCVTIRVNDKSNERWLGERGLDLSPSAVAQLTRGRPTDTWSYEEGLELCK